jgi:quercetin dioxygenase-like cupin family protein
MAYQVLHAADAHWRPSNQTRVLNTDVGRQLGAERLTARFWRLHPGEIMTRHRHREQEELYVLIDGTGRMRVDGELITLEPTSAVFVGPDSVRQVFNDTDQDALWLIAGAPADVGSSLDLTEEDIAFMYPDGPKALPPELMG